MKSIVCVDGKFTSSEGMKVSVLQRVKYGDLGRDHEVITSADFWGEMGQERLVDTEIGDAIETILDDILETTGTIEVVAFKKMEVSVKASDLLNGLLEELDQEYGDPEGDHHEPTDKMKAAAENLARVVEADYETWACEDFAIVEVDIRSWIIENRPEWLENKNGGGDGQR